MTTWFTADLHLGHANIIDYCDRPFRDVAEMNAELVRRWNQVVSPTDLVWVVGDVAMGRVEENLELVGQLAGHKRLVCGNHDRCWSNRKGWETWADRYRSAGFEEIFNEPVPLHLGRHPVLVSHFPYRGDSHAEDRFVDARPVDRGMWLLHGHVHGSWRTKDHIINVGVDVWDYAPVNAATLTSILQSPAKGAEAAQ